MSNLVNGDTWNGSITLTKRDNTKITLATDQKYVAKGIELTVSAQSASPAFDGGALNNKSASAVFTNATTSSSNSSGIAVLAKGTAGREAVLYNGAVNGWVNAADDAQASAAVSSSTWDGLTYYLTGVTLTNNKTFNVTVPEGQSTHTYTISVDSEGNVTGLGSGSAITFWDELDSGGGTIRHIEAVSLAGDTVTAASLLQGYTAHNALGQPIVGTAGGSVTINLEDITVTPSTQSQTIQAGTGYDGIGIVSVEAVPTLSLPTSTAASATSGYTSKATIGRSTSDQYINIGTGYNTAGAYYKISAVPNGTAGTPTATKGSVSNHSISVTPSVTNTTGYITGSTKTGTAVTVSASELVSGNKSITSNGTNIDVTNYATVSVSVSGGGTPNLQAKTNITPTESSQTITADDGYDGLSSVQINAISSTYVGSGITSRSSTDLSESGGTVSVPAGYYASNASKAVTAGSVTAPATITGTSATLSTGTGTLTLTKTVSVTPSVTTAGYISSGTAGDSSVSLTASVNIRDSSDLSASGATVTAPAGYYAADATTSVSSMTLPTSAAASATSGYTSKATISRSTSDQYINIPTGYNSAGAYYKISAVANGTVTAPATISGTSATVSTGTGTLTLTKTVSVTPNVTTTGYISSGTAGNSSVSLTASVTIDPTPSASGATVTIPAGYYTAQTTKSVSTMTLPTSASSSATSGYTSKATISRSTSDQYINIPTGYNSSGAYYKINAVANGSATGPTSLSGSSATVSTGTNTITLTKTNVTTTPTVSAGYVSSATASTATVTLTASVTTKAATTYHPSTSDQTISSGTYTTGTQTFKAVVVSGLAANKVLSGTTVKIGDSTDDDCVTSVAGSVTFQTIYSGSANPSSGTGVNGDIYVQT